MSQTLRLTDGDGHVLEDELAIAERLSAPYREVRRHRIELSGVQASARSGLGGIFPPMGHLSNMPVKGAGMLNVQSAEPPLSGEDPDSWEAFLNAVDIEKTVLYPTWGLTIGAVRDLDYAVDVARAYNDWLAETYLQHPSGRFQGVALLPMQMPEAAAAELDRVVTKLGFCAAVVPTQGLTNHLGSSQFWPVYEAAAGLDVGLSFHGGGHAGLGMDDFNALAPAHAIGHPLGLLKSLAALLFNGVFDAFPKLRVAFLEGGSAWVLLAAERFSESYRAIRPADDTRLLKLREGQLVSDYMIELCQRDRLVFGCEGGEDFLVTAMDYLGCTPFMYSSDFPHEVDVATCRQEVKELGELKITDDAKERLRGGTARRYYKL